MQDVIETDVAIVGGGLAGLFVAMGAAEQGARVVVMEKAKIERSGAIAGGVDHCLAYLNEGEWWDTRDGYLDFVKEAAAGAVDIAIHEKIFCDELDEALKRMERIGCPMHDPAAGKYQGLGARGASPAWHRRRGRGRQGKRRSLFTLAARGESLAWHRDPTEPMLRSPRARREEGEYREYSTHRGQRPAPPMAGCIGDRMQRDFHHGLLAGPPGQRRQSGHATGPRRIGRLGLPPIHLATRRHLGLPAPMLEREILRFRHRRALPHRIQRINEVVRRGADGGLSAPPRGHPLALHLQVVAAETERVEEVGPVAAAAFHHHVTRLADRTRLLADRGGRSCRWASGRRGASLEVFELELSGRRACLVAHLTPRRAVP